jgi:hypothetical protein
MKFNFIQQKPETKKQQFENGKAQNTITRVRGCIRTTSCDDLTITLKVKVP